MTEAGESGLRRVGVVVLDWNGGEETLRCLSTVRASLFVETTIVLVDNASSRPVLEDAARRFPGLTTLRNASNLGYAGGNNVGIRHLLDQGCDAILILNNDAFPAPDALARMLEVAASDEDIAAVGARILELSSPGQPPRLWMAWGRLTWRQSLVALEGRGASDAPRWHGNRDVEWVSGCALLLLRRGLERVGFFDEDFFAYLEEVDWCTRARAAGLRIVFAGEAAVEHRGEASSGKGGYVSRKQYLIARNAILFARRHGSPLQRFWFQLWFFGSLPFQFLRRWPSGEGEGVVLKLRGALDALRGRPLPRARLGLDP